MNRLSLIGIQAGIGQRQTFYDSGINTVQLLTLQEITVILK